MSQDTTKKSGTKRKTTPTKRSVEPLKETGAEHASGALKIFSSKKYAIAIKMFTYDYKRTNI